jgi:hypothetical protein
MGKITGFLEIDRIERDYAPVEERIKHWHEFLLPLPEDDLRNQAARCMDCGIPFCQGNGSVVPGTPGCPVNNQIPDWNDLVYHGAYPGVARLKMLAKCCRMGVLSYILQQIRSIFMRATPEADGAAADRRLMVWMGGLAVTSSAM